jgi:type 1 glutamine amidotransferase
LAALDAAEWQFEWIEDAREWSAARLAEFPLVVLAKSNQVSHEEHGPWITPEVEEAFVQFVRAGGGLLVLHSGTAGLRESPTLYKLIGGVFTHHPPQCEVTITPQGEHLITLNVEPFTVTDEHYHMETDDLTAHHFLTTTSVHGVQAGGWLREEGDGRVCVLTPAHNLEVWLHPEFQTLLRNGLRWCAGTLEATNM